IGPGPTGSMLVVIARVYAGPVQADVDGELTVRTLLRSGHDTRHASHQRGSRRHRAVFRRRPEDGRELHQARARGVLRRAHVPPRDPRLHDPGRLPAWRWHGWAWLHVRG